MRLEIEFPEYEFISDKNILIFKPSLVFKSQNSPKAFKEIIDLIIKHRFPNTLADFRGLDINFSIWSAIDKPKEWVQFGMSKKIKIAGLFDKFEEGNMLRTNKLFSQGFRVSAFTDYDKAIEWLSVK